MGDFEIFIAVTTVLILGIVIYNVINCFALREILKRFGFLKISRRDFYECGFRPTTQKPIQISFQFLLICIFFILYDSELIFLFPFATSVTFLGLYDCALLFIFFLTLLLSLIIDFNRHALVWQY